MLGGLSVPETVAMVLGIILFVFMLVVLIVYLIRKQPLTVPAFLLILPVVMILWPTISIIEYENGKIVVRRLMEEVAANPGDTLVQQELATAVKKIEGRLQVHLPSLLNSARGVLQDSKTTTQNLSTVKELTKSGEGGVPPALVDSLKGAIDDTIAVIDSQKLSGSGLKQLRDLRNWQEVFRADSIARVVARDPGDTAAARMLKATKAELRTRGLTPEQLNVTKRLKI